MYNFCISQDFLHQYANEYPNQSNLHHNLKVGMLLGIYEFQFNFLSKKWCIIYEKDDHMLTKDHIIWTQSKWDRSCKWHYLQFFFIPPAVAKAINFEASVLI